jgi:hypothetical protein
MNRVIYPKGRWKGWYFSEELKDARDNFGYSIKLIKGYIFIRNNTLFANYVKHFYDIKSNPATDQVNVIIAKLFLNSLYGRFGMRPEQLLCKFLSPVDLIKSSLHFNILRTIELPDTDNGFAQMVQADLSIENHKANVNVAIAAAITAYGRIHINRFQHMGFDCYYSDTDSVILNGELPDCYVGKALGQMKLETSGIDKAVFLGPKVYGYSYNKKGKNKVVIKVKGLAKASAPTLNQLQELLAKDYSLLFTQTHWVRDISSATITVKPSVSYTLQITNYKRKLLYNDKNILVGTQPYTLSMIQLLMISTLHNRL